MNWRTSSGCNSANHDGSVRKLVQQQALRCTQSSTTRARAQTSRIAHVFIVPMQLIGDVASGWRGLGDCTLFAQHLQQVTKRGAQIVMNAQHRCRTVAAREVLAQELFDRMLVQMLNQQVLLCHPAGEVGNAGDVALGRVGSVAATPQVRGKRIEVWRERAIEKPRLGRGVKRGNEFHDGLQ